MSSSTTTKYGRSGFRPSIAWALWIAAWVVVGGYLLGASSLFQRAEPAADEILAATEVLQVTAASFVKASDSSPTLADGSTRPSRRLKNIEDIQIGDVVLAMNDETGEVAPKRVVALFRNTSDHLRLVRVRTHDGVEQELQTTDEHPFFVADRGWVEARLLATGDEVVESNGAVSTVVASEREEHPKGIEVFNFEVEEYHTYFVAEKAVDAPVLVHNRCSPGRTGKQTRLRELLRDPNVSSADRGWIKQEINAIQRGQRSRIRVPPGKNLAHRRGFEAKNGFGYDHSDIQDIDLHRLQHHHEGY